MATDLLGNEYHETAVASCKCGHSRADHSSNDYDLTFELGACLVDECGCSKHGQK